MELQTKVTLPSNGKLYKLKEVTIKPMTSDDFDIINDSSDLDFVYKVIQNSIVEPKDLKVFDLHPFDIDAILFALRNLSIGPTYEQSTVCPYCHTSQNVIVDMDKWETEILDKAPISAIKMPNGDVINITYMTEKIQHEAREQAGLDNKKLVYYLLVNSIKSIKLKEPLTPRPDLVIDEISSQIEIEQYIQELSYKDRLYLQQATTPTRFGVDTSFVTKCSNASCGREYRVIGAIDGVTAPEFFRPTLFKE